MSDPQQDPQQHLVLPNGLPRTCCEDDNTKNETTPQLTEAQQQLSDRFSRLVGSENVLHCQRPDQPLSPTTTAPYLVGAREVGHGANDEASPPRVLCIVTPRELNHVSDLVEWAVQANCVVLVQGQNTGLTGGSVPHTSRDRPVVVLSMKHLTGIVPLDQGQRVICMAGVGLASVRGVVFMLRLCLVA